MTALPAAAGSPRFIQDGLQRPFVIGHRGASRRAPENTLAAFRMAFDAGADAIELDVRQTADGRLVVLHDATLSRTTDRRGPVRHMVLADISRARCVFAGRLTGEPVPTLEAALELLPAGKRCLIEVKSRGSTVLVVDVVRRSGAGRRVGVCSLPLPLATRAATPGLLPVSDHP